nr:MAG TPA: hypothetical protein [Caudoviricetes sp.]
MPQIPIFTQHTLVTVFAVIHTNTFRFINNISLNCIATLNIQIFLKPCFQLSV